MSVESYLATVQRAIRWALRDLTKIMEDVDLSDPDAARDRLQAELPSLVVVWGEIAATQAAEYFEELIEAPAVLADPVAPEVVESDVGWAVGPLYGKLVPKLDATGEPVVDASGNAEMNKIPPDPAQARRQVVSTFEKRVHDQARNTIRQSAEATPGVGWARVLSGAENCAWCTVMASRGAVFESRETAQMRSGSDPLAALAGKTHRDCDCELLPIRDERDYPPGYDADRLYDMYMTARRSADAKVLKRADAEGDQSTILGEMRRLYGMH